MVYSLNSHQHKQTGEALVGPYIGPKRPRLKKPRSSEEKMAGEENKATGSPNLRNIWVSLKR